MDFPKLIGAVLASVERQLAVERDELERPRQRVQSARLAHLLVVDVALFRGQPRKVAHDEYLFDGRVVDVWLRDVAHVSSNQSMVNEFFSHHAGGSSSVMVCGYPVVSPS